jgi:hypothetical protein
MAEVTVDATWRLSRMEFTTPYNMPGSVRGNGEVLLRESGVPSDGASVLRGQPAPLGEIEPDAKVYGTMPGATVVRSLDDALLADTITVDDKLITFETVYEQLQQFMEKWRVEDAEKPPVAFTMNDRPSPPPPVPVTPMPPTDVSTDPRANG